ncbi:MAG: zf-TFIIB domain-containing protein [Verrucomicrobiota bacterium]
MNCPVCASLLSPVRAGSVTVDVCLGGCGGIWFDNFELQKLDDPRELEGELLIDMSAESDPSGRQPQRRSCPRCADKKNRLRAPFYSQGAASSRWSPRCGGFWLDAGELALIREELRDEQQQVRGG